MSSPLYNTSILDHLDDKNTYVRMLFNSAFNTIVQSKLISKLLDLGITSTICNWLPGFLTTRPYLITIGDNISSTLTVNTGAPQGCVFSLYYLFTNDCVGKFSARLTFRFTNDCCWMGQQ